MIYMDNAATTQMDAEALDAMLPFLQMDYANASQPYSFSRTTKRALREAREDIANCINASPDEVFFTSGGTESDNWALKGMMTTQDKKSMLITSLVEHHAVLRSAEEIKQMGFYVEYLPVDSTCVIQQESLKSVISNQTKLVSIMCSNNEVGTIEPIKSLVDISHEMGAYFHSDAVQAVGHVPIDVKQLGVDMLSASAHKFNGPKGIGFLYIKKGTPINPFITGGGQEKSMRAGTENVASIVGMAKALQGNCLKMAANHAKLKNLESCVLNGLVNANISFVQNGGNNRIPGVLSLSFPGLSGEMLLHRLDLMGICVSTGAACDSKNTKISHVLTAMGIASDRAQGTIRISLGKNNTEEDVLFLVESLRRIIRPQI